MNYCLFYFSKIFDTFFILNLPRNYKINIFIIFLYVQYFFSNDSLENLVYSPIINVIVYSRLSYYGISTV